MNAARRNDLVRANHAPVIALLAALIAGGCVRFQPQPVLPDQNLAQLEQRSLSDETLRAYIETNLKRRFDAWPPAAWDLESLTLAAFYFHPALAAARSRYETVLAGKVTAAERPNPTLSVNPAYNSTTAVPSPWLVTASVDVPIETAGKRGYRRAQAAHLSSAARYAIATVAWDVRAQLRRAMLELWAAQETETLLREKQTAQAEVVDLLEKDYSAGAISRIEVTRERIALSQTRIASLDAETRHDQARAQLAGAVGVPTAAFAEATFSFQFFNQTPFELPAGEARRRALLNRPDILGALAEYAASEAAVQLEVARQYPDVHLSPGYEFDQGDNKWGLGLGVELPVFNHNRGRIGEAEAQRREVAAKFNALQARVLAEIEGALAACANTRQKLAAAATLLEDSAKQEKTISRGFEAGEVSRQAVAAARLEKVSAAEVQLDARWKTQLALAALESALQTPLELPASLLTPLSVEPERP